MGTTDNFSLPFPEHDDSPAGHTQIQDLAEAVDAVIAIRETWAQDTEASQSTTSAVLDWLGTPDRVDTVTVPENGMMVVHYEAVVSADGGTVGQGSLFVDDDPVSASPPTFTTSDLLVTGSAEPLIIADHGALFVLTNVPPGLPVEVGVKYRRVSGAGSVHVAERRLRVFTIAFNA